MYINRGAFIYIEWQPGGKPFPFPIYFFYFSSADVCDTHIQTYASRVLRSFEQFFLSVFPCLCIFTFGIYEISCRRTQMHTQTRWLQMKSSSQLLWMRAAKYLIQLTAHPHTQTNTHRGGKDMKTLHKGHAHTHTHTDSQTHRHTDNFISSAAKRAFLVADKCPCGYSGPSWWLSNHNK